MTDELEPVRCGCGGEAILDCYLGDLHKNNLYYIYCAKCDIRTSNYLSEAEAVEAWNKAMGAEKNSIVSVFSSESIAKDINVLTKERTAKVTLLTPDSKKYWSTNGRCQGCGFLLKRKHAYCPNCGARLEWK